MFTIHGVLITMPFIFMNHQTTFVYKYQIHSNDNTATYFKNLQNTQQHALI